jgi:hypothetical protein
MGSVTSSQRRCAYFAMYSVVRFLVKGNDVCREREVENSGLQVDQLRVWSRYRRALTLSGS